jgi:hypothetical protein
MLPNGVQEPCHTTRYLPDANTRIVLQKPARECFASTLEHGVPVVCRNLEQFLRRKLDVLRKLIECNRFRTV